MLTKPNAAQLVRFCIVGGISMSVNYAIFFFLLVALDTYYLLAGILGSISSMIPGFYLNRTWTFRSDAEIKSSIFSYLVAAIFVLGAHSATQWFVTQILLVDVIWSQLFSISVATILSFTITRKFVFTRY